MQKLIHLLKHSPRAWMLVVLAVWLTGYYRWQLLHVPFAKLAKKIGSYYTETGTLHQDAPVICDIQYAVIGVSKYTPWESKCLVQALAAKKLLNLYHLPCTLYMGVRKDEHGEMLAHAWLRCGDRLVTGGRGHKLFTVTAIYGDPE